MDMDATIRVYFSTRSALRYSLILSVSCKLSILNWGCASLLDELDVWPAKCQQRHTGGIPAPAPVLIFPQGGKPILGIDLYGNNFTVLRHSSNTEYM